MENVKDYLYAFICCDLIMLVEFCYIELTTKPIKEVFNEFFRAMGMIFSSSSLVMTIYFFILYKGE